MEIFCSFCGMRSGRCGKRESHWHDA